MLGSKCLSAQAFGKLNTFKQCAQVKCFSAIWRFESPTHADIQSQNGQGTSVLMVCILAIATEEKISKQMLHVKCLQPCCSTRPAQANISWQYSHSVASWCAFIAIIDQNLAAQCSQCKHCLSTDWDESAINSKEIFFCGGIYFWWQTINCSLRENSLARRSFCAALHGNPSRFLSGASGHSANS